MVSPHVTELLERLRIRRSGDAALGDDGGDEVGGCDIEGGVVDVDVGGGGLFAEALGDFGGGAVFDGNLLSGREGEVDAAGGGGDEEGEAEVLGEDGDTEGADLVGDV